MLRRLSTKSIVNGLMLVAFTVLVVSCSSKTDSWESFGAEVVVEEVPATAEVLPTISTRDTVDVKFVATIEEVCQMKGCWMTLKSDNGERIRVTFKDYGFFVPKDAAGREVIIDGIASLKELDEETAKHFADDSGREFNPETDMKEVSIVASGVLIKKPNQL